ncbi:TFCP2 factor, partial [Pachyramphus minor]|nr:TFCP2 factor [Pachyramphus minor]
DVLALPIFKQEEPSLPPESQDKVLPFQYVLCAATSPAVKLHDETLTYLNQGEPHLPQGAPGLLGWEGPGSIFRVVFHDRRLQYTEHQQLEGWRWNRPGDRILDIDIPMSVGIIDPRANPSQLNTVEFLWDPAKRTSVFIQVSTGGHRWGVSFIQVSTGGHRWGVSFIQVSTGGHRWGVSSARCSLPPWPRAVPTVLSRAQDCAQVPPQRSYGLTCAQVLPVPSPVSHLCPGVACPLTCPTCALTCLTCAQVSPVPSPVSPVPPVHRSHLSHLCAGTLVPTWTPQEAQQWLHRNRFSTFSRLFRNFSGADLLKLSRDDVIQICGAADGIRLFNALKGSVPRPVPGGAEVSHLAHLSHLSPLSPVYHALYLEELTAAELSEKLAQLFRVSSHQIQQIYKQGPTGIHVLVSDEMIQNFQDESCFVLDTMKAETSDSYHVILK